LKNSFIVSLSFKSQLDKPYYFTGYSTFEQGIVEKESDITIKREKYLKNNENQYNY